jgi:hypothetical protein
MTVHSCNSSYEGGINKRILAHDWPWKKLETLSRKITKVKKAGGCGSSNKVLVKQVGDPEFKFHIVKKKKNLQ